jgi:LEA14-like dessication related protein
MHRRRFTTLLAIVAVASAGCSALPGREPVRVIVVDVSSLPGEAMEMRLAVKLRIQNPNPVPLEFQGVSITLEVRGATFASGVASDSVTVAPYGESVVTVPVSVGALAALRQVLGWVTDDNPRFDYLLRGRLGGGLFGGVPFESQGQLQLPGVGGATRPSSTP